jgi:hypothetical protein
VKKNKADFFTPPLFQRGDLKPPFVKGRFRGILSNVFYPTLTWPWAVALYTVMSLSNHNRLRMTGIYKKV